MNGILGAFIVAAFLIAVPAEAGYIKIDQGNFPVNGTLTYGGDPSDPDDGVLKGSDIQFVFISGVDTPQNAGLANGLVCVDCFLEFETGQNTKEGTIGDKEWEFAGGGFFTLEGQIPDLGFDSADDGPILDGVFGNFAPNRVTVGLVGAFIGFGYDIKATSLVEYFYGITVDPDDPPIFMFGSTNILGEPIVDYSDGSFTINVSDGDIRNQMPVPGSSLLILLGLAGLAGFVRRRS
jgi:hypothetical protein